MSWYEYKPEPKHYTPHQKDDDSRDAAAAAGLILPVLLFLACAALFLFSLF